MAIAEKEEIRPRGLTLKIDVESLRRNRNGDWYLVGSVSKRIAVDLDRSVMFAGEVRLKGKQEGRKSR